MSTEVERYFNNRESSMADGLKVAVFAEVIKIDLEYMRLDVKVDMTAEDKEEMDDNEIVMQVPIGTHQTMEFVMRPPYAIGDKVLLIVSHQDIDPILFGGGDHSREQHNLDNALVISGVTPFTNPLPSGFDEHIEDYVIAKRDFSAKIIIKKNSEILIESTSEVHVEGSRINLNCR